MGAPRRAPLGAPLLRGASGITERPIAHARIVAEIGALS